MSLEGFSAKFQQKLAEKRAREEEAIKTEYNHPPEIDMEATMNKFEEIALSYAGSDTCRINLNEISGVSEWKRQKINQSSSGIYVALIKKHAQDTQNIIDSVISAWNSRNPGFLMTWNNGTFFIALPKSLPL